MNLKFTDFGSIIQASVQLRSYLESHVGALDPGSAIARDLALAEEAHAHYVVGAVPPGFDEGEGVLALANVACLNRVVLSARDTPDEQQLLSRLRDLKRGDPGPLDPAPQSLARDRTFETLCWHTVRGFSTDPKFEEPDIVCGFRGSRWGLACKVSYGSAETTAGKIRDAIRQIGTAPVDWGFVVVQLTNKFPHGHLYHKDETTRTITSFRDIRATGALMAGYVAQIGEEIDLALQASHRAQPLSLPRKVRGLLYALHTLPYHQGKRAMMGCVRYSRCHLLSLGADDAFVEAFNEGWQEM